MVIEKVHGLQSTAITLNERFTMLTTMVPELVIRAKPTQKHAVLGSFLNQNLNFDNRMLIQQIAKKLQQQANKQTIKQRIGRAGQLRQFASESNLPGLRRSNSFGNLSQRQGIKNRISWRQSNGNLSRSVSFGDLSQGAFRGRTFRRRGGRVPVMRGRMRGRGGLQFRRAFGLTTGRTIGPQNSKIMRGRGRGKRGGLIRNQINKPVPTKEELDAQLDQYMASTKSALDKELDAYMKNVMELQ